MFCVSFVSCSCPKKSRLAVSQLSQPGEPHLSELIKDTGQKRPKTERRGLAQGTSSPGQRGESGQKAELRNIKPHWF